MYEYAQIPQVSFIPRFFRQSEIGLGIELRFRVNHIPTILPNLGRKEYEDGNQLRPYIYLVGERETNFDDSYVRSLS